MGSQITVAFNAYKVLIPLAELVLVKHVLQMLLAMEKVFSVMQALF